MTFTGGVSLAVWMGGIAREMNLLLAASRQAQAQYWTTPATVTLPSIPSGTYNITSYGASTSSANNAQPGRDADWSPSKRSNMLRSIFG